MRHSETAAPANGAASALQYQSAVQQKQKRRTIDVEFGAASFHELLLPNWLLDGLAAAGFLRPSPVQTAAIPIGRMGSDLVVQAKSGTGKTLVLGIICLDKIRAEVAMPQALVLAPTHEIALQTAEVVSQLAEHMPAPGISVGVFIGGLPIQEDQKLLRRRCQIAVGTPGRVCRLLEIGALVPKHIRTLVLDEADHLMSESFIADIRRLARDTLPQRKQVVALSATYSPALLQELDALMEEPHHVMLCPETVSLLGVKQFYAQVSDELDDAAQLEAKILALLRLLSSTSFHQALVFLNSYEEGQALADRLSALRYPATFVSGAHTQVDRMDRIAVVQELRVRVVVATDLAARGLDLTNVSLVANMDLPYDAATYMHRVGRTGRFGTHGVAVAFVSGPELERLQDFLQDVADGQIEPLPERIPEELYGCQAEGGTAVSDPVAEPVQDPLLMEAEEQASGSAGSPAGADAAPMTVWTRDDGSLSSGADSYAGSAVDGSAGGDFDSIAELEAEDDTGVLPAFCFPTRDGDELEFHAADSCVSQPQARRPEGAGGAGPLSSNAAAAVLGTSLWASGSADPSRHVHATQASPAQSGQAQQPLPPLIPLPPFLNGVVGASVGGVDNDVADPELDCSEANLAATVSPGGNSNGFIPVSPDLLVRYYQLEAFAAEYYVWFCQTQQHQQH